ncbi:hypothetical protein K435DRAFT_827086 [Dendrothele bispora CBS 962.96]|uniref:DUF202 domain-containing protein n=1 Tax=Dendrothele bispora (strain CBS 962.96) TaxID=1314807 RepID=A0A4S8MKZ7_DENBC|nr:hypothetical protein K435DRAFT_827086 [Dendrothele bispora CBS 962.96]
MASTRSLLTRLRRGRHRADSYFPTDVNELIEIRARQRTFHGAYLRTALGNLGYALTILRLFNRRFYRIGLLFAVLGGVLFILAFLRDRHSRHDFADPREITSERSPRVIKTVGVKNPRIFGRPFITAGWIVIAVSIVVFSVEVGLLVLILKL